MRKLLAVTFIVMTMVCTPLQVFGASFTLDDCLRIALSDNPTIRVADMEVTKADYSKKESLGALLPTISFDGSYSRTLRKQVTYMDFDAFGDMMPGLPDDSDGSASTDSRSSSDEGFKVGLDNMYSLGFQFSIPLIAPQLWQSLKVSDDQIARSVEAARASRLDMVNQVKNAFYALLLAYDSAGVVDQSYDMALLTHDIYEKRFAVGDASEYDVLRTSVALKNIEPEIIQCQIAVSRAHLQLAILMGIDPQTEFTIEGSLADYESVVVPLPASTSLDLADNTSLIMNAIETRTLSHTLALQKASLLPTLALGANYNWNSSSNGSPFRNFRWTPYSMIGVSLSIPIIQGGQRYSRIRQAQIALEQMEWTRQNLVNNLTSQVSLAVDNINLNVKQIASSTESVAEASRAHSIMQRSFEIGAASYLDLRDSELSLTRARLAYYQAIYNYLVADSDLELLLGNAPIGNYVDTPQ